MKKSRRKPAYQTLDPRWVELISEIARKRFGLERISEPALIQAVAQVSQSYTQKRELLTTVHQGSDATLARLVFFLLRDLPKTFKPLNELAHEHALPHQSTWRVLDLGAGLGTTSLGLAHFAQQFMPEKKPSAIEVTAIDQSRTGQAIFEHLVEKLHTPRYQDLCIPITLRTQTLNLEHLPKADSFHQTFDWIVAGFTLNELFVSDPPETQLQKRVFWLQSLERFLAPEGTLLVLEPALKKTTRALHAVRDALMKSQTPFSIFAPCLHAESCPMLQNERDWCHEEEPWRLPEPLIPIARGAGLRYEGASFSYLSLRKDGKHFPSATLHPEATLFRVVSEPRVLKGHVEFYGCGQTAKLLKFERLHRHRAPINQVIDTLERGQDIEIIIEKSENSNSTRISNDTHLQLHHANLVE